MHRRFFSASVRPNVYFALAGLFALMVVWLDLVFIPSRRYSLGYFGASAVFAVPGLLFLCLGVRSRWRRN
ncbi:MAG: hypothetical protein JWN40_1858 [Phycisphaerales bacterium]|nr:hypothetical protein [Phycisphaerales bacterium]